MTRTASWSQTEYMEFGVLGPVEVRHAGRCVVPTGGLQRLLLAMLLARPNRTVTRDLLVETLWGDSASRAESNLHVMVHRLRRKLPDPDRLVSDPSGYRLVVREGELDAERFERMVDDRTDPDPMARAKRIRAALEVWRGDPYEDVAAGSLAGEVLRLNERRLTATVELYTAELEAGRHAEIVPELADAATQYPLDERLCGLQMAALYRSGRQGHALAAYQVARSTLIEELGQEPGPDLRELERRILAGEQIESSRTAQPDAPPPAQLPGDVPGFTGRPAELATLDALFEQTPAVGVVTGTGGAGKTALALHWAHRTLDRFPDGQLYVDLHGFGPDPPLAAADVLGRFLRALGVEGAAIPADVTERTARFRTLVSGRRLLIVLDNAASADQVRPLLPGGSKCLTLVTSRDTLPGLVARDGARRILLDRLALTDSVALLEELVGPRVRANPEVAAELAERCSRLPLAIRVAAELINARPTPEIGELARELADNQSALDVLDAGGDEATAVRTVFSWSYRQLPPEAAHGFRLLGLHPGYDIDSDAAEALFDTDRSAARHTLRTLLRAHLLEERRGRFRMHDLLRAYAVDLAACADDDASREAALLRLFDHYARRAEDASSEWVANERSNLALVAQHAVAVGHSGFAIRLAMSLHGHLKRDGHHDEALTIYAAALDAEGSRDDPIVEGDLRRYVGAIHRRVGRMREAHRYMDAARRCYESAGATDRLLVQLCNLGVTCTWLGRYDDATAYLTRARVLAAELAERGRFGAASARIYLAQAQFYQGRLEEALSTVVEAIPDAAAVDQRLQCDAEALAGLACVRLGRDEAAHHHLERALTLARAQESTMLEEYVAPLSLVYWRFGRPDDAFDLAYRCIALIQRSQERTVEPDVRCALADLHLLAGDPGEARAEYAAARDVAEASELPYQLARAELGLGDAESALGDRDRAMSWWTRAQQHWDALGSRDRCLADSRISDSGSPLTWP